MSEEWKKQDRPCPPCEDCGTFLYEKFWGNGGWAKTEIGNDEPHDSSDCVKVLRKKSGLDKPAPEMHPAWKKRPALTQVQAQWMLLRAIGGSPEVSARAIKEWEGEVEPDPNMLNPPQLIRG